MNWEIGDLSVHYMFENGIERHNMRFKVPDVQTAAHVINSLSLRDLKDDNVGWNFFDFEIYENNENEDDPDWYTWYSEDGLDINEWMNENGF